MTRFRSPWNWTTVEVNAGTWRGRALRYLLIYLALLLALVALRYATQDVRPQMLRANKLETLLTTQRNTLSLEVQSLETLQRTRNWAFAHGMRRFADAPKDLRALKPAPPAPSYATLPPRRVEVTVQWK